MSNGLDIFTAMRKNEKVIRVLDGLRTVWPSPETELEYVDPWQLLVAVILSAQCTDKRVNIVTPALFEKYPTPESMSRAEFDELFPFIQSISYPNNKTKHLLRTAEIIVSEHGGEIPRDYDALLKLPGVGRKTANVVNSVLYNEPRMPVDTHVFRVTQRLGLTKGTTPHQIEKQLVAMIPEELIPTSHHLFILHGRYTCKARKPMCDDCPITELCSWFKKNGKKLAN